MTYQREISENERLYLAAETLCPPFVINMVVEGEGELGLEALRRAVERASAACPGARLVARRGRWVDSGKTPPVRRGDIESSLRQRMDIERGPTCEVIVGPNAILFRAFHGVMDGKGLLLWVHDVFRVLRGETPLGASSTLTDSVLVARLGPRKARRFDFDCPSPFGPLRDSAGNYVWKRRTLRGSPPALVARVAALLCAARALRVMVPVDLRRHVADVSSTGNLSMPIFLDVRRGEPWEDVQERLLAALSAGAELTRNDWDGIARIVPRFGLTAMVRVATAMQRATGKFLLASAIVSHLGRLDLTALSAPNFLARTLYSLPSHAPLSPVSLVAADFGSHVELALSCSADDDIAKEADALLNRICAALDASCWAGRATQADFPDQTVVELFHAQVARRRRSVALVQDDREVSYEELDQRSEGVARALSERRIGEGALVGLLVDRSIDGIVALWGVLKSGAAYLPLDPRHPDERLRFMLADADVRLCLTQKAHAGRASELFRGEALCVETIPSASGGRASGPRSTRALAYVIYTSGSTGQPKGVQIEHRALVNYVHWAVRAYECDARTRFALFTSLAFDLTVTSLFVPLLCGGSVALFPEELDHLSLRRMVTDTGVDSLKLTPSHLDLLSRLDLAPSGLRLLVVGGEQFHGGVAARAQRMFGPGCHIVNEYGPTETTVGCVHHVYGPADEASQYVPIGVPISNVRIELLDAHGGTVPRGESGEIHILGEGLARGYLGRPDLDRLRFVELPDGRAYRTGDLARIREDGLLEFLGRIDDQIKVRGHRVEPGEVEAVLRKHPAVRHVVVVGREVPGGGVALCAYAVASTTEQELLDHVGAQLPPAMVPSFVSLLERVPLTVHGKVDLKKLPAPFVGAHAQLRAEPPRDDLEADIAAIWGKLLSVDPSLLGPDANFLRLGGDSLTMLEMLARVARALSGTDEARFMRSARSVVRCPTLSNVRSAVLTVRGSTQ